MVIISIIALDGIQYPHKAEECKFLLVTNCAIDSISYNNNITLSVHLFGSVVINNNIIINHWLSSHYESKLFHFISKVAPLKDLK